MRNRVIQVKMVKTNEAQQSSQVVTPDYTAIAHEILVGVAATVFIYMGADTVRQSILHVVRTKIT